MYNKYVTMISCFLRGRVCICVFCWLKFAVVWFEDLRFQISVVEFFLIIIVFSCWDHFSFDSFFFLITWWYIFFSHKWPLLLFEPYKSDSRAVNRAPPELGFGTPLGGKLGFWSAASPTWLRVPTIFKKDLCHCLWFVFAQILKHNFTNSSSIWRI